MKKNLRTAIILPTLLAILACNLPARSGAEAVPPADSGEATLPSPSIPTSNAPLPSEAPAQASDPGDGPTIGGCPLFPADHIWNTPVEGLPIHPRSGAYIASIGADTGFHPDFGSGEWEGEPIGIPVTLVDGSRVDPAEVEFYYPDESDPGPYPIPDEPLIEGGGDRHILLVDTADCTLYELYDMEQGGNGSWSGGSGAIWDLTGYSLRPDTWTSADAAGLPITAGLVRYEEVAGGAIHHALRFTAEETQRAYVWPARHYASDITDPDVPPMGQRFRLKADFDLSGYPAEVQVIFQAMKTYGIILADNGSDWFVSGEPNPNWDNEMLVEAFRTLQGSDFEAVDVSGLLIDADSGQAR
jgi:hypothetical protein